MEGWRQERLGSRAGTHREKEKNKNILTGKEKRKTYLTLTGLLMEGVSLKLASVHTLPRNYLVQALAVDLRSHENKFRVSCPSSGLRRKWIADRPVQFCGDDS